MPSRQSPINGNSSRRSIIELYRWGRGYCNEPTSRHDHFPRSVSTRGTRKENVVNPAGLRIPDTAQTLANFSTMSHTYVHAGNRGMVAAKWRRFTPFELSGKLPFYAYRGSLVTVQRTFSGVSWWQRLTADTRTIILSGTERMTVWPEFRDSMAGKSRSPRHDLFPIASWASIVPTILLWRCYGGNLGRSVVGSIMVIDEVMDEIAGEGFINGFDDETWEGLLKWDVWVEREIMVV